MEPKKRVLVTGAAGTVGLEAVKMLVQQSDRYEVIAFDLPSKKNKQRLAPLTKNVHILYGNISDKEVLESACKDIDFVIHLAAVIPPLADERPELASEVNTQGTAHLVAALERVAPQAFLLYSSSISVYGDRIKQKDIRVTDKLQASLGDEYALTKIAAEEIIQHSNLHWTIFRLSAIMGGHKISKLMFHMPLDTPMEIATSRDTARAFVNGLQHTAALDKRIFNVGGGPQCRTSFKDFLERSFAIYGLGKADFEKHAFAEKNFHCGYYADGDDLENIVHFRRDTLEDYFKMQQTPATSFLRLLATPFAGLIKKQLVRKSEPLHAYKTKDKALTERFFN